MKTTFIIDCSAIFYQVINRTCGYNGKNIKKVVDSGRKYLTEEREQLVFLQDIHDEFNKLNNYTNILGNNGIFFAFDSLDEPSFRFSLHPEYKKSKSRLKEQVYDRDIFKNLIKTYYLALLEKDFKTIHASGVEADDIFLEIKKVVPLHDNIGIITSDSDIDQMLDERTFIYNPIEQKTKITSNFRMGGKIKSSHQDVIDFFFDSSDVSSTSQGYERFFSNSTIINPELSLFKKLIIGDDMDNIPSFFRYKTKNGTSEFGFTKGRYEEFEKKYPELLSLKYLHNDELFKELLLKFSEIVGRPLDTERIAEYIKRKNFNNAMINLSESSKYHKKSPELYGMLVDQYKKPEVNFGVISFYESDVERY